MRQRVEGIADLANQILTLLGVNQRDIVSTSEDVKRPEEAVHLIKKTNLNSKEILHPQVKMSKESRKLFA